VHRLQKHHPTLKISNRILGIRASTFHKLH